MNHYYDPDVVVVLGEQDEITELRRLLAEANKREADAQERSDKDCDEWERTFEKLIDEIERLKRRLAAWEPLVRAVLAVRDRLESPGEDWWYLTAGRLDEVAGAIPADLLPGGE